MNSFETTGSTYAVPVFINLIPGLKAGDQVSSFGALTDVKRAGDGDQEFGSYRKIPFLYYIYRFALTQRCTNAQIAFFMVFAAVKICRVSFSLLKTTVHFLVRKKR